MLEFRIKNENNKEFKNQIENEFNFRQQTNNSVNLSDNNRPIQPLNSRTISYK